jgi:phosphatidylglycerophosphate synthase
MSQHAGARAAVFVYSLASVNEPLTASAEAAPETVVIRATADTLPGAALRVAGLTVLERAVRQRAGVAGASVAVVSDGSVPLPALPPGVRLRAASQDAPAVAGARAPEVVPANLVDPAGRPGAGAPPILVTDEASRVRAETAVFEELLRGDLGLVARFINKPISFRLTRHFFCKLPITPNQITIGAGLVGLAGAALIATGRYAAIVAGFALAHAQSVLDGCDGELARVRFQRSALGEWLDTFVDDALNLALIGALALAARAGAVSLPHAGAFSLAAGAMLLFYNVVCYRELVRQGEGGSVLKVRWWFARGADMKAMAGHKKAGVGAFLYNLGRRDVFVLVWLALAIVNRLDVVVLFALVVAGVSFVVAAGQLVVARERP